MQSSPEIIFEDNHLLVINKPAMLPTIGTGDDRGGLTGWAREWIRERYDKPGNVFVGVVHRLDAWVSGVLVMARTSKAAARLGEQFHSRSVDKKYWALLEPDADRNALSPSAGTLEDQIFKDDAARRMVCRPVGSSDFGTGNPGVAKGAGDSAQLARLTYQMIAVKAGISLAEIELETGRKHQIRAQFASQQHPVQGDSKYGGRLPFPRGIALHSRLLAFDHPTRRERLEFRARLPMFWPDWARKLDA